MDTLEAGRQAGGGASRAAQTAPVAAPGTCDLSAAARLASWSAFMASTFPRLEWRESRSVSSLLCCSVARLCASWACWIAITASWCFFVALLSACRFFLRGGDDWI